MKRLALFLIPLGFVLGCVEPFDVNFDFDQNIIVIDANVTNIEDQSFIRIRESTPSGNGSFIREISGASAYFLENGESRIDLQLGDNSFYFPPDGFTGKIGNKYQLFIELADGRTFESTDEELISVPPISEVFYENDPEGIIINDNVVAAQSVYVNTNDPADERNFYSWTWELYESQRVCISCDGGRFFIDPLPAGRCINDDFLSRRGVTYDYYCDVNCFDIFRSETLNTQTDQFSNGLQISNVLLEVVPFSVAANAYMVINQQALSQEAYDYSIKLKNVGQNTGGLADTPPSPLIGNIRATNSQEIVSGYFITGGISRKQIVLDRTEFIEARINPYGLLDGRNVRPEPASNGPDGRPPMAPCLESRTRTRTLPLGF